MKAKREKRGQFVIIAMLMASIMIISIGAIMHSAITYYKHEPWDEYATVIGNIEVNSRRLLELSLVKYSNDISQNMILIQNLVKWEANLTEIYPNMGIVLKHEEGGDIMNLDWNKRSSKSIVETDFDLSVNSIGLEGYPFTARIAVFLDLISFTTINATTNERELTVVVRGEDNLPIAGLRKDNFKINSTPVISLGSYYDDDYILCYKILFKGNTPVTVEVVDQRGIKAVGLWT